MRFSNATIVGIAILILGTILLAIRAYLDVLDKIIVEKSSFLTLPTQHYWGTIMTITYICIILCCVGVIVLSIVYAKQKMSVRK